MFDNLPTSSKSKLRGRAQQLFQHLAASSALFPPLATADGAVAPTPPARLAPADARPLLVQALIRTARAEPRRHRTLCEDACRARTRAGGGRGDARGVSRGGGSPCPKRLVDTGGCGMGGGARRNSFSDALERTGRFCRDSVIFGI